MEDDSGEPENEQVVSISEFIEGMEAQQLEADLVLGGDEGKDCTYEKGHMRRQAVFSCLTCTPTGNAGFCTACSLVCHDGHEVAELWTRRGFRCDCGNEKFGVMECKLYKDKAPQNKDNVYNQNYGGLYCSCHRPFPDPDKAEQGEMLQCCICEDWFHETHLGLSSSHQVPRDDDGEPSFDELICPSCVSRCSFLSQYPELLVPPIEAQEDDEDPPPISLNMELSSPPVLKDSSKVLERSLHVASSRESSEASGSQTDINRSTTESSTEKKLESCSEGNADIGVGESSNSGLLLCKLRKSTRAGDRTGEGVGGQGLKAGEAVFLAKSWRAELCQCDACLALYALKNVGFLLDREDTLQEYEETAKRKRVEVQEKEEVTAWDFMKKLGHVQKMELVHGFNDMATELGSFLAPFGQDGRTVTSADIYEFFEKLQQKRKRVN